MQISVYLQMCMYVVLDICCSASRPLLVNDSDGLCHCLQHYWHVCVEPVPCLMANRDKERHLKLEFPLEINHMKCNLLLLFEVWIVLC